MHIRRHSQTLWTVISHQNHFATSLLNLSYYDNVFLFSLLKFILLKSTMVHGIPGLVALTLKLLKLIGRIAQAIPVKNIFIIWNFPCGINWRCLSALTFAIYELKDWSIHIYELNIFIYITKCTTIIFLRIIWKNSHSLSVLFNLSHKNELPQSLSYETSKNWYWWAKYFVQPFIMS